MNEKFWWKTYTLSKANNHMEKAGPPIKIFYKFF